MRLLVTSLFLLSALGLSGCSANYNCKGFPDGVSCLSAREVYTATEYVESLSSESLDEKGKPMGTSPARQNATTVAPQSNLVPGAVHAVREYRQENPLPIRTPEQVMEVWIAPWEDRDGSLHMASTVYTEIERRRWTVGDRIADNQARIQPLDVRTRNVTQQESRSRRPAYAPPPDFSTMQLSHPLQGEPKR